MRILGPPDGSGAAGARFLLLLGVLAFQFVLLPTLAAHGLAPTWLFTLVFVLTLLSAMVAVEASRWALRLLFGLLVVNVMLEAGVLFDATTGGMGAAAAVRAAFIAVVAWQLLRFVLARGAMHWSRIAAAICVYVLIGALWRDLYVVVASVNPHAFRMPAADAAAAMPGLGVTLAYFSFVTLTTLGYGDIVPVDPLARALAFAEAAAGQLFLTVLVAWLVGLHVAGGRVGTARAPAPPPEDER